MKRLVVLSASLLAMTGPTAKVLGNSPRAVQVTAAEETVAPTLSKVRRSWNSNKTPTPLAVTAAAEPVISARSVTRKLVDEPAAEPVRRSSTTVRRSLNSTNVVAAPATPIPQQVEPRKLSEVAPSSAASPAPAPAQASPRSVPMPRPIQVVAATPRPTPPAMPMPVPLGRASRVAVPHETQRHVASARSNQPVRRSLSSPNVTVIAATPAVDSPARLEPQPSAPEMVATPLVAIPKPAATVRRSLSGDHAIVVATPPADATPITVGQAIEPSRDTTRRETPELAAQQPAQPEPARAVVALAPRFDTPAAATPVAQAPTAASRVPASLMTAYRPQSVTARVSEVSTTSSVVAAPRTQPPVPQSALEPPPAPPEPAAPTPIPMADEAAPPQVAKHTPEPIVLDEYEPYCDSCHHDCYGPVRLCRDIKSSARQMYQHFPYEVWPWTYYYFRPYNYRHVAEQQEQAAAWGADPRQPYSRAVFDRVYEELAKQFEPKADAE